MGPAARGPWMRRTVFTISRVTVSRTRERVAGWEGGEVSSYLVSVHNKQSVADLIAVRRPRCSACSGTPEWYDIYIYYSLLYAKKHAERHANDN